MPKERRAIELGYRPGSVDARGPTVWQIFGGIVSAILGMVAMSTGALFVWLAALPLGLFTAANKINPSPAPELVFVLLPALLCFFSAFVMFRMSLRLFRSKKNSAI